MHPPKAHVHSLNRDNLPPAPPTTLRPAPPARPAKLPYPPTTENIPKLEQYIKNIFSVTVFNNLPPFPALSGPAAKIYLKENAIPAARRTPMPIPHHWKAEVKAGLDRDIKQGIIDPVSIETPVTWCSPMVVASKPDRTPCCAIDFQKLNAQCLRETHHTAPPFQLASKIPPHTKKTVIDAADGYQSAVLDSESHSMTTFINELGRYMYFHRASLLLVTPILAGMMPLLKVFHRKLRLQTTFFFSMMYPSRIICFMCGTV